MCPVLTCTCFQHPSHGLHACLVVVYHVPLITMTHSHRLRCGRPVPSSCLLLLLTVSVCAAVASPCASGAARGHPAAAAPPAAFRTPYSSADRLAALGQPTQAIISDVVSMLHGGLPSRNYDLLVDLRTFVHRVHQELQLDPASYRFAAGMVVGVMYNNIYPSMQWPFQQYSGSFHWLRRLEGGLATADDEALLDDATYSSRYPAGLWSDWEQVRPHHPFHPYECWVCPAPLLAPVGFLEAFQAGMLPNLNTQMVIGWQETPAYGRGGHLVGLGFDIRVVDIDNPAGPACEGCRPYTFQHTRPGDLPWRQVYRRGYSGPGSLHVFLQRSISSCCLVLWMLAAAASVAWGAWGNPRQPVSTCATRGRVRRAQLRRQHNRVSTWLHMPRLIVSYFQKLPGSRAVLWMLILEHGIQPLEHVWPFQAMALGWAWAQLQYALHSSVANCLGCAVFIIAYWLFLGPNRGSVTSLLTVLAGAALLLACKHYWLVPVLKDCPGCTHNQPISMSGHLTSWSWAAALGYLLVRAARGVAWGISRMVGAVVQRVWPWLVQLCGGRQPAHTTDSAQHTWQQQRHGYVSSWPQQLLFRRLRTLSAIQVALRPSMLLIAVVLFGASSMERRWPSGAVAAARWWAGVQQTLSPLVADCLGNAVFGCVYWAATTREARPVLPLRPLLMWSVMLQCVWCFGIASGVVPRPVLLSTYLKLWAIVTQGVHFSEYFISDTAADARSRAVLVASHAALLAEVEKARARARAGEVVTLPGPSGSHHHHHHHRHPQQQQQQQPAVPVAAPTSYSIQHRQQQQQQSQQQPPVTDAEPTSTSNPHHSSTVSRATSSSVTCCRVCGMPRGPGVKLFKCSRCGGAADRYCSGTCFRVDWPRHHVNCRAGASLGK